MTDNEVWPITGVVIVADITKCPARYMSISRTYDSAKEADLWRDGLFGPRVSRYMCVQSSAPVQGKDVLVDVCIINDRDPLPTGFTALNYTSDTREKATKKKLICLRWMNANLTNSAMSELIILPKNTRKPPNGYTLIGELSNLMLCYKMANIKTQSPMGQHNSNPSMNMSALHPAIENAYTQWASARYIPQGPNGYHGTWIGPPQRTMSSLSATTVTQNKKISGQPFRKAFDNTLSEAMMEILTGQMKSVGVLMSGDDMLGTVFRVGKACIMTALHVITCVLGPADNGSGDTSKLEDHQICVHFYKSGTIGNVNPPVDIFYLRREFISNFELDVAILEISNPEKLPCKMRLSRFEVDVTDVSLIGYGNPKNAQKKVLDPRCEVIHRQSERMDLALSWLKQNKSLLRSRLQNYAGLIDIGYQGYDNPSVLLFDCFINHGASGAPILSNNNENSVTVVGVLTHGLPEFYFKLPDHVQKDVPYYCKLELGAKMKYIYDWIAQSHPELVQDFYN